MAITKEQLKKIPQLEKEIEKLNNSLYGLKEQPYPEGVVYYWGVTPTSFQIPEESMSAIHKIIQTSIENKLEALKKEYNELVID